MPRGGVGCTQLCVWLSWAFPRAASASASSWGRVTRSPPLGTAGEGNGDCRQRARRGPGTHARPPCPSLSEGPASCEEELLPRFLGGLQNPGKPGPPPPGCQASCIDKVT